MKIARLSNVHSPLALRPSLFTSGVNTNSPVRCGKAAATAAEVLVLVLVLALVHTIQRLQPALGLDDFAIASPEGSDRAFGRSAILSTGASTPVEKYFLLQLFAKDTT